jgi:hypothetical protein
MMRFTLLLAAAATAACVAAPAPEANGYNVELYFEGAPLGAETPVGEAAIVTVRRIEQRPDRCTGGTTSCDPTAETPIVLLSASCDSLCTVESLPGPDGVVTLSATADHAGSTTLRVRVRSVVDGAEWDDGYPLAFRNAMPDRAYVPWLSTIDKTANDK